MAKEKVQVARKFRNAFLTGLLIFLPWELQFSYSISSSTLRNRSPGSLFQLGLTEESFFFGLRLYWLHLVCYWEFLDLPLLGFLSIMCSEDFSFQQRRNFWTKFSQYGLMLGQANRGDLW